MNAIHRTPVDACRSSALFSEYLSREHDASLDFYDFDERVVCDCVHLEEDSKNYHVWTHRMWFLTCLPFLHATPNWADVVLAVEGTNNFDRNEISPNDEVAHVGNPSGLACFLPGGEGDHFVRDELIHTSDLILADWFNNSAWCHRFAVIQKFVLAPYEASECRPDNVHQFVKVMYALCRRELAFALHWAAAEPCNECPFVYAKGIADLYQLAAVKAQLIQQSNGALENGAEACLSKVLRFEEFSATYKLHDMWSAALEAHVAPLAEALFARRGDEDRHQDENGSQEDVARSRFLRNNTHQVTAALFKLLFDRLEATWSTYFSPEERLLLQTTSVKERFLGAVVETEDGSKMSWQTAFESWEVRCVELGKELYARDGIRSKYWKHEVHVVIHRQY